MPVLKSASNLLILKRNLKNSVLRKIYFKCQIFGFFQEGVGELTE